MWPKLKFNSNQNLGTYWYETILPRFLSEKSQKVWKIAICGPKTKCWMIIHRWDEIKNCFTTNSNILLIRGFHKIYSFCPCNYVGYPYKDYKSFSQTLDWIIISTRYFQPLLRPRYSSIERLTNPSISQIRDLKPHAKRPFTLLYPQTIPSLHLPLIKLKNNPKKARIFQPTKKKRIKNRVEERLNFHKSQEQP